MAYSYTRYYGDIYNRSLIQTIKVISQHSILGQRWFFTMNRISLLLCGVVMWSM